MLLHLASAIMFGWLASITEKECWQDQVLRIILVVLAVLHAAHAAPLLTWGAA